ncbi:2-oxoacid:acceptor oxidoreductase family protein [Effusibacillus pohliae]|uniref:2-oxoacid:acceptor oxidoreductase family protein n=1 Tax=Effusibacillus pohliae TaxID=232270 RepID=UPI00058D5283|nr:2-oxoacid:acceptor oxidoreductase family protein [Effusibacillus pohliae]
MKEIRFHGRGGQGAVMASELLVQALVREGNYGQSIPAYGFERRGAPLQAFVKLDHKPIRERVQVYRPDGIIVLDESLLAQIPVYEGLKHDSFAVLNSRKQPNFESAPQELQLMATVDANRIALEIFKAPITNTILLGAFSAATGLVGLDSLKEVVTEFFPKKIVDQNLQAVERGFKEVSVKSRQQVFRKAE